MANAAIDSLLQHFSHQAALEQQAALDNSTQLLQTMTPPPSSPPQSVSTALANAQQLLQRLPATSPLPAPAPSPQSEKQKLLFENATALIQEAIADPEGFADKLGISKSGSTARRTSFYAKQAGTPTERIARMVKWLHEQGANFDHKMLQRHLN